MHSISTDESGVEVAVEILHCKASGMSKAVTALKKGNVQSLLVDRCNKTTVFSRQIHMTENKSSLTSILNLKTSWAEMKNLEFEK